MIMKSLVRSLAVPRVLRQFGSAVIQFLRETIIHIDNVFYLCSVLTLALLVSLRVIPLFCDDKLRALNFVINLWQKMSLEQ